MRSFLAGLVTLLLLAGSAAAQVTGYVDSVGIEGRFRPDCWTPLFVKLTSQVSEPMTYQIQVWQEDLDRDHVVYTRDITLSPKIVDEQFEVYFVPQPTTDAYDNHGLPSLPSPPGALQKALHVRLCLPPGEGKKPEDAKVIIDRLNITFSIANLDPARTGFERALGTRFVLWVTDGSSMPAFAEYRKSLGLMEQVEAAPIHVRDLGESPLFYSAVDAVVWLSGNADDLDKSGARRREALEQYVRQGGNLVVCQPENREKIEALGDLLPIEMKDAAGAWQINFGEKAGFVDKQSNDPKLPPMDALPALAAQDASSQYKPGWHLIKGPIRIARAKPLKDAVVDAWQDWLTEPRSPFIVRGGHGLGCVTWVAQDLGDVSITSVNSENWPHVWDRVLGWRNRTVTEADAPPNTEAGDRASKLWDIADGGIVDFGQWTLKGTDFPGKGAAYILMAVLFFILYWVGAGPGSYFFLASKKKKELNWFVFGAWAFAGTAITILVVKLVLRGDAEARHLSVIRTAIGQPSYVYSRVGLYVPRDGDQTLALTDTNADAISYITPLQIHPEYVKPTEFAAAQQYSIPEPVAGQPVSVRIPFRSTLKKLQTRWVGDLPGGITGSARLVSFDHHMVAGTLTNQTGTDLKDVYVVYNYVEKQGNKDWVLFLPHWPNKQSVDLNKESANAKHLLVSEGQANAAAPSDRAGAQVIRDPIAGFWEKYWLASEWKTISGTDSRAVSDFDDSAPRAFPIMSLFDRVGPQRNASDANGDRNRVDFMRRGGRELDMSAAVAAGKVVILAQSADDEQPLPAPITVDGSRVGGQGRILFQFALTPDRTEMEKDAAP